QAKFNIAGGFSLATGDFGDRNDAGYSMIVGVGMAQRGSPLSFRLEGMYNAFEQKFAPRRTATANGLTANTIYEFATPRNTFTPYFIGGIGMYSTREPFDDRFETDSRTDVGWNLGAGLRFPLTGFSAYFEARYHSVSNAGVSVAPVVFGLSF
ncbi:MAG TPA: outer membrane beta-barrel protein, partial [Gemmatimonadaceae bacterium]